MEKKKKVLFIVIAAVLVAAVVCGAIFLPPVVNLKKNEETFRDAVLTSGIYQNDFESLYMQPDIYDVMYEHVFNNTSGKTPKLLFIGYDGCRADMLSTVKDDKASGVARLYTDGTLLLCRAGGENKRDQNTDTAPGWAAIFTGMWGKQNGVVTNGSAKKANVDTIMKQIHIAVGLSASFSYSWKPYHTTTYADEAKAYPELYNYCDNDILTIDGMVKAINDGKTAVFGVLEYCDSAGHNPLGGFDPKKPRYITAFEDSEKAANQLIDLVEVRDGEDWLIIIASDHGGYGTSHGDEKLMVCTTFFAMNKKL